MKHRSLVILVLLVFLMGWSEAYADTLVFDLCSAMTEGGGIASFPCVVGPDEFGIVNPSGNDNEDAVEAALAHIFGTPIDIMVVQRDLEGDSGDFDFTPDNITGGPSFDWEYFGPETLWFATVKASTYFAIYYIGGATSGSMTTDLLITVDGELGHDASHVSFWKEVTSVPEPNTLAVFGLGLLALGFLARRARNRI